MSYLLEALKESQRRRDDGRVEPLFPDKAIASIGSGNGNHGNSRKYVYLATLALALGVVGGWVYSVKEEPPGADELPAFTQSADVSSGEVALVAGDAATAKVEFAEPQQPEVRDQTLSPIPGEARDEEHGEDALPELPQSDDIATVQVALAAQDPASARAELVESVEPEQPAVKDKVPSPIQKDAVAESRDLDKPNKLEEVEDSGQISEASELVALNVAMDPAPVVSPASEPPQRVTRPVQDTLVAESPVTESPVDKPVDSSIPHLKTLPFEIQQEIGPMDFSVHIYSRQTSKRFVSINGTKNREGDRLDNGVLLESIVSSGAIFTYKGHRFWIPLG